MDTYTKENKTIDIHKKTGDNKDMKVSKAEVQEDISVDQANTMNTKTENMKSLSDDKFESIEKNTSLNDVNTKSDTNCSSPPSVQKSRNSLDELDTVVEIRGQEQCDLKTDHDEYAQKHGNHHTTTDDNGLMQDHYLNGDDAMIVNDKHGSKTDISTENKKNKSGKKKDGKSVNYKTVQRYVTNPCKKVSADALTSLFEMKMFQDLITKESLTRKCLINIEIELKLEVIVFAVPYCPDNTSLHIWDSTEILRIILRNAMQRRVCLQTEQFRLATFRFHNGLFDELNILHLAKKGFYCDLDGRILCYNCNSPFNTEHVSYHCHCGAQENTSETIADHYGAVAPTLILRRDNRNERTLQPEYGIFVQLRLGQTSSITAEGVQETSLQLAPVSSRGNTRGIQESELSESETTNIPQPASTHQHGVLDRVCQVGSGQLVPSNETLSSRHLPADFAYANGFGNIPVNNSPGNINLAASLRESNTGPTFVPDTNANEQTRDSASVEINNQHSNRGCKNDFNSQQANASVSSREQSRVNTVKRYSRSRLKAADDCSSTSVKTTYRAQALIENPKSRTPQASNFTYTERTSGTQNTEVGNQFEDLAGNKHRAKVAGYTSTKVFDKPLQACTRGESRSYMENSAETTANECKSKKNPKITFAYANACKDNKKSISRVSSINSQTLDGSPSTNQNISDTNETLTKTTADSTTDEKIRGNGDTNEGRRKHVARKDRVRQKTSLTGSSQDMENLKFDMGHGFQADQRKSRRQGTADSRNTHNCFLNSRGIQTPRRSQRQMAKAGLLYTDPGDRTRSCYVLDRQQENDPVVEHARNFPNWPLSQQPSCTMEQLPDTREDTSSENESLDNSIVEENAFLRNMLKCRLCDLRKRDTVFLPCGHKILCGQCSNDVEFCPNCSKRIAGRITTN